VVRSRLSWVIRLSLGVDRDSLVRHIGDVSVVVVGGVLHVLGPAVGESNAVGSCDGTVRVSGLGGVEGGLRVVIGNTVFESIGGGLLLVIGAGLVGSGGRVVGGGVVGSDLHDRGVVDNGGSVVDDGSRVVGSSVVDHGSWVIGSRGVVDRHNSVGHRGRVVGSGMVGGVVGNGSGGVHSGHGLLVAVAVGVHRLRGGMGLAGDGGVVGAVRLVHRHGDGGGVAVLHDLVVRLVTGDHGQKGCADKGLHVAL